MREKPKVHVTKELIAQARQLLAEGLSVRKVAKALGITSILVRAHCPKLTIVEQQAREFDASNVEYRASYVRIGRFLEHVELFARREFAIAWLADAVAQRETRRTKYSSPQPLPAVRKMTLEMRPVGKWIRCELTEFETPEDPAEVSLEELERINYE